MSELLTNPMYVAGGITTVFLIAGTVYEFTAVSDLDDNIDIDWYEDLDYNEEPPLLELNRIDDEECAIQMEKKYAEALYGFEDVKEKDAILEASYQAILDKQEQYGVNLVDNYNFLVWTTADWEDTYDARRCKEREEEQADESEEEEDPDYYDWEEEEWKRRCTPPELDWSMRNTFVSAPNSGNKKYLKDIDDIADAMSTLFYFRSYDGLEDEVYGYDHYYEQTEDGFDWDDFDTSMCSSNTQDLSNIYSTYITNS